MSHRIAGMTTACTHTHLVYEMFWRAFCEPRQPTVLHTLRPAHGSLYSVNIVEWRGGGLGSRPKKMYGERLGDGVEYHLMKPMPRR